MNICLIACHTNSDLKIKSLKTNIEYLSKFNKKIVIINSNEFKNISLDNYIPNDNCLISSDELWSNYKNKHNLSNNLSNKDIETFYFTTGIQDGKFIKNNDETIIYFKYAINDDRICYSKIHNYYKNYYLNSYDSIFNNIIVTNDSYLLIREINDFTKLFNDKVEMTSLLLSHEGESHYTDFLRRYNINGFNKSMKNYEMMIGKELQLAALIRFFEIDSYKIFRTCNYLFDSPKKNINIHFIEPYCQKYLNNKNYPVVKLKKIQFTTYNNNMLPKDFNNKIYQSLHLDLSHLDVNSIHKHFINHGWAEGRKYKVDQNVILHKYMSDILNYKAKMLPEDFNNKTYQNLHPDLSHLDVNSVHKHYLNHGYSEGRKYKADDLEILSEFEVPDIKIKLNNGKYTAISLHNGNMKVLYEMIINYRDFFYNEYHLFFISVNKEENLDKTRKLFPNAVITFNKNQGMDVGGFLNNMKKIIESEHYDKIEHLYVIHTKTNKSWRDEMLNPIINNKIDHILDEDKPIIVGSNKYKYSNNKLTNRRDVISILDRNNIDKQYIYEYKQYMDEYIYDINSTEYDRETLNVNHNFYKTYESDLSFMSTDEAKNHWSIFGKTEFHRIPNPCYIKNFAEESYFIAGTTFACNKEYFKIFEHVNLDYEFSILEHGALINDISRRTHAWEYFHGLSCTCLGGEIVGIDENGEIQENNKLNLDIYKCINKDLSLLSDDEVMDHYNKNNSDKNYSIRKMYAKQSVINYKLSNDNICIILDVDDLKTYDYLQLDKFLNSDETVDLYLNDKSILYDEANGININCDIDEIINIIKNVCTINLNKINFFIGNIPQINYLKILNFN